MDNIDKYSYYLLKDRFLARGTSFGCYEWFEDGEWTKNKSKSLCLTDSMMDYGDCSPTDYRKLSKDKAMNIIENLNLQKR